MGDEHILSEIEAALQAPSPQAFSPALERQYQARQGQPRRLRLAFALRLGAAGILAAFGLDLANGLSRIAPFAAWRAGLVLGCLAAARLIPRATRPWQETLAYGLPCLGVVLVTEVLGQLSLGHFADRYEMAAAISGTAMLALAPVSLATSRLVTATAALLFPVLPLLMPGTLSLSDNWDLPVFAWGVFALAAVIVRRNVLHARVAFLHALRHEVSAAEMTLLNAELLRVSSTDWLTGLPNRRSFDQDAQRLWQDTRVPSLGLALIDVDCFKAFNDAAGHEAGDACLRGVAELIAGALRGEERAARYGGEEFAVLLPSDTYDMAPVGERLRRAVEQAGMPHPGLADTPVTISVGLACRTLDARTGTTPSELVREADGALYAAKRGGRNRVAVAGMPRFEIAGSDRSAAPELSSEAGTGGAADPPGSHGHHRLLTG